MVIGYKDSLFYHINSMIFAKFLGFFVFFRKRPRFAQILIQSLSGIKKKKLCIKKVKVGTNVKV